jgi:signal transduction histidine kinase
MFDLTLLPLLAALLALFSLLLIGFALRKEVRERGTTPWLLLYLLSTTVWFGALALAQRAAFSWPNDPIDPVTLSRYGVLIQALLFLRLSRAFFSQPSERGRFWARLGAVAIGLLFLNHLNILPLPARVVTLPGWTIPQSNLILLIVPVAWLGLKSSTGLLAYDSYNQTRRQPLHRNRLTYWLLALALLLFSDALFWVNGFVAGTAVRLTAVALIVYVLLTYRLPDVRRLGRRALSYGLASFLVVALYGAGFFFISRFLPVVAQENPWLLGGTLTLLGAVLFAPFLTGARRLVGYLTADTAYNANQVLREYSLSISNIVELSRLEAVMMGLIVEAMDIQHGTLFLVDHQEKEDIYSLRSVQSFGADHLILGRFDGASPITRYFHEQTRALLQYDVDLRPEFRLAAVDEREWLITQDMEVYVPICAHGKWIGLLGLGPKLSRLAYDKDDLILLSTLADQTAVALENARLFADLYQVNVDLQRAYTALEQATNQLQEMDRLKSAFIGAVTHELRTPFANIAFSLQLLQRYGTKGWPPDQADELSKLKSGVDQARRMVDNLVNFASFLSKQGALRLGEVEMTSLIEGALLALRPSATAKGITLQFLPPGTLPAITADGERLGDVLYHLGQNAIKFTGQGGLVTICVWTEMNRLMVEVQDTGVGIPADRIAGLWEGFTQMADPLRRGVEGLGLGLTLVKYVITAHDGQVWASSEEGVGSAFGFHIPIAGPETPDS